MGEYLGGMSMSMEDESKSDKIPEIGESILVGRKALAGMLEEKKGTHLEVGIRDVIAFNEKLIEAVQLAENTNRDVLMSAASCLSFLSLILIANPYNLSTVFDILCSIADASTAGKTMIVERI